MLHLSYFVPKSLKLMRLKIGATINSNIILSKVMILVKECQTHSIHIFDAGYRNIILVGTDTPGISAELMNDALRSS